MTSSPVKKRKISSCMSFWMKLNRLVNLILAIMLGFTAYLQVPRADAVVWVAIFMIPAIVTLLTSLHLHLGARAEIKVVSSVHVACCLCLLVYLGTRLVHGMAHQHSSILIVDKNERAVNSYNPLDYREGWEIVAVIMIVLWMKFLSTTTRETLRESGIKTSEVSPRWMLQSLAAVIVVALGLAGFCYVEGVSSAAKNVYHTLNTMADHRKLTNPIPQAYNPMDQRAPDQEGKP